MAISWGGAFMSAVAVMVGWVVVVVGMVDGLGGWCGRMDVVDAILEVDGWFEKGWVGWPF
jgi:hypothetical protein